MGKYEPLTRYLKDFPRDSWDASFEEIERILEFELPPSARRHNSWWANTTRGNHSQSKGWIEAGWGVRVIDRHKRKVLLERSQGRIEPTSELAALWRKAQEISGISNRAELEKAAVQAFIKRTAAQKVIELGGTMPDFKVPPRERPTW